MPHADEFFSVAAEFDNLEAVKEYIRGHAMVMDVPDSLIPKLELVMEEIFLNIVNHARPRIKSEVEIRCWRQVAGDDLDEMFCVAVRDWGRAFNPLGKETPALEQDVEDRPIGGLGIYLVIQMADHCSYKRQDGSNLFTVCFNL